MVDFGKRSYDKVILWNLNFYLINSKHVIKKHINVPGKHLKMSGQLSCASKTQNHTIPFSKSWKHMQEYFEPFTKLFSVSYVEICSYS